MKRTILSFLLIVCMLPTLVACGSSTPKEPPREKIGISLPNNTDTRWKTDGATMSANLSDFDVEIRYADDNADTQITQIRELIELGCKTLIVAAVDPTTVGTALSPAPEESADTPDGSADPISADALPEGFDGTPMEDGINLIAYDQLITDCYYVDYYVGFDGYEAGYLQASFLEEALNLYDTTETYHVELFFEAGDNLENQFQYEGAMEILQMYIDSGTLVIGSGQSMLDDCAVDGADGAAARMTRLLSYYGDTELDAILCADDSIAQAVTDVLFSGYSGGVFPLVTGMGCTEKSVNALGTGVQAMTLLRDCTGMAEEAAAAAADYANGVAHATEDSLDNGSITVPASLFYPESVYVDNIDQMLVVRGYFTRGDDGVFTAATDYTSGYTGPRETEEPADEDEPASSEAASSETAEPASSEAASSESAEPASSEGSD